MCKQISPQKNEPWITKLANKLVNTEPMIGERRVRKDSETDALVALKSDDKSVQFTVTNYVRESDGNLTFQLEYDG